MEWPTWREATQQALYGTDGFFRRESPSAHFRTSAHAAADLLAAALLPLARAAGLTMIVDVGAGGGELLAAVESLAPDLTLVAIEVADRPKELTAAVRWSADLPDRLDQVLLFANEWLDNIAVDVAEVDADGVARLVHVDPATGNEALGEPVTGADAAWLDRWWPLHDSPTGTRAEIGHPRDATWARVIEQIGMGLAIAVDYSHRLGSRPAAGTLTGYRAGRLVRPVPDGSCDLTSHVALDACAAAGVAAGATDSCSMSQREALEALGMKPDIPTRDLAVSDPVTYLSALNQAGRTAELLSTRGLGGFGWLVQTVHIQVPDLLRSR